MRAEHRVHDAYFRQHPEEAAGVLETLAEGDAAMVLARSEAATAGGVLARMQPHHGADVLAGFEPDRAREVVLALPPHVAAGLLQRAEAGFREPLLADLPRGVQRELATYMAYPPDTAGAAMDPQVLALPRDLTVERAVEAVRHHGAAGLSDVYVIDRAQTLLGAVSLRELLLADPAATLETAMRREPLSVHPMESREAVVELCTKHYVNSIPVVDADDHLLGVIRTREIFMAGQEEAAADMVTMVGGSRDERALSPVFFSVRKRLPWLQVNLLTAFLAAAVVGLFEDTIARFTALAVLLPVVAGQSGNAGAQSLAVVMRGLALRDVRPSQWLRVSVKELLVGAFNGVLVAVTTGAAVYVWSGSPGLVLVIVVSMVLSMCAAGLAGAMIPNVLRMLEQDPAQSSSIILTTVTDVVAFFSFLGLASVLSSLLV